MKILVKVPFLLLVAAFICGCLAGRESLVPGDSITPTPVIQSHTATLDLTETLPPTPTRTQPPPTLTATPTSTLTPSQTATASPTPTPTAATLGELVTHLDTPEKLSQFLLDEIEYSEHGGCISYWPDVFYQKRQGNCKDYSTFASYVLAQHGYEAQRVVYTFYRGGVQYGHEVASYRMGEELWIMSNGVIQGPFENLSAYFESLYWLDYVTLLCIKPPGGVTCCRP